MARRPAGRAVAPGSRLAWATITVALVLTIVPLGYLIAISFMGKDEISDGLLVTLDPKWGNWVEVLTESDLVHSIGNSLLVAVPSALLTLAGSLPAAWAIARYRTGGSTLVGTIMSPWLLPPIVAVVPLLTLLRTLGLNNTLTGLVLIYTLVNIPVAVWILQGFVHRIPIEIEEAAAIDGAGSARTLWHVVLPLAAPGLVAVGVIVAILNYNEFVLATFLTQSPDAQTLPVALSLFYGERTPHFGKIAAASIAGVVPVFVLATLTQRWLVGGLTAGAAK